MTENPIRDFYGDALAWGMEKHEHSPEQHHIGFAWIIAFACGDKRIKRAENPGTIRVEYGVTLIYNSKQPGQLTFEEVIELLEAICYGPITDEHAVIYYKQGALKGDYPVDVAAAQELLANLQPTPLSKEFIDREAV